MDDENEWVIDKDLVEAVVPNDDIWDEELNDDTMRPEEEWWTMGEEMAGRNDR
ncbi:hypothetical protein HY642_03260 [Candidatus Woesearchaeota archaeon]|nr:hypothetical protein [Candidatus Woesearchaeota archaeon]